MNLVTIELTKNKIVDAKTIERLTNLFKTKDDYFKHLNSLKKTRLGLLKIMELNPQTELLIRSQFDSINNLIDVILNDNIKEQIRL